MAIDWRKAAKVAASIVDQAWLSGISLLISLLFVRELEKSEYGLYVLLFNTALLFQGLGGAVLAAPYTTLHPRHEGDSQQAVVRIFTWGTLVFAATAALVAWGGYLAYGRLAQDPLLSWSAGLGFAACVLGSVSRDNIRVYHYSRHQPVDALWNNLVYGALLLGGLYWLVQARMVSAAAVLMAIGLLGAALSVPRLWRLGWQARSGSDRPAVSRALLQEFGACGRWASLGSFVTFLTYNTYPYLAAASFSKAEVADIAVARLLAMPITLIGSAWSNLMRSRLSQWEAQRQYERLDAMVRTSVIGALLLSAGVGALVLASGDLIRQFLGEKYANVGLLSALWMAQAGLAFIKGIYTATLMTGQSGFKDLSRIALITLATTVVAMLLACATPHPESIVLALVALELFQIHLIRRQRHLLQDQRCPAFN